MDDQSLIQAAVIAREAAYAPYSGFKVGAALLTANGSVYTGCNIENAAFTPGNCAERTAFFKAVSEGERFFTAIAVAGWDDDTLQTTRSSFAWPCGVCRQVMMEFCHPEHFRVMAVNPHGDSEVLTLAALLPHGFGPDNLHKISM